MMFISAIVTIFSFDERWNVPIIHLKNILIIALCRAPIDTSCLLNGIPCFDKVQPSHQPFIIKELFALYVTKTDH